MNYGGKEEVKDFIDLLGSLKQNKAVIITILKNEYRVEHIKFIMPMTTTTKSKIFQAIWK